jgi:glycine oxidase
VVGGGVIGSSIAYHMAKNKMKVLLLEKGRLAGQASGAAAGMLAAQAETDGKGPLYQLAKESRAMFPRIAEELKELSGIDIGWVSGGIYKLALTAEEAEALRQSAAFQLERGDRAEWLERQELLSRLPALSETVCGGLFLPEDGQVSAPHLSLAFAKAAAALGAEVREFVEIDEILCEHSRVIGVAAGGQPIYSGTVVVACGAWSSRVLSSAGIELAAYPVKGECFSVVTHKALLETTVFTDSCYAVPKAGGRLLIGATMEHGTFDRAVTAGGIAALLARAQALIPGIARAEWEQAWSGLRPQTPDGLPYLGSHPQLDGLLVATGHFRNGILLSPITGRLIAELAAGGEAAELDPFRPGRPLTLRKEGGTIASYH